MQASNQTWEDKTGRWTEKPLEQIFSKKAIPSAPVELRGALLYTCHLEDNLAFRTVGQKLFS